MVRGTSYFGSPKILLAGKEALREKTTSDAVRLWVNGCLVEPVTAAVLRAEVNALLANAEHRLGIGTGDGAGRKLDLIQRVSVAHDLPLPAARYYPRNADKSNALTASSRKFAR